LANFLNFFLGVIGQVTGLFGFGVDFGKFESPVAALATDDVSTPKGATGTQVCSSIEITIQQKYKSKVRNIILKAHIWFV